MFTIGLFFFYAVWRKGGTTTALFELGPFYISIVLLYTVIPMALIILRNHYNLPLTNGRLDENSFGIEDVAVIGLYSMLYIGAFSGGYLIARGNCPSRVAIKGDWRYAPIHAIVVCIVIVQLLIEIVNRSYKLTLGSYWDMYIAIDRMPMILKQLYSHAQGWFVAFLVMGGAFLFGRYKKYRYVIYLCAGTAIFRVFYVMHSRFDVMLILGVCILHYDRLVKRLRLWKVLLAGGLVFLIFDVAGLMRSGERAEAFWMNGGEFEAMFVNALDLRVKRDAGMVDLSPFSVVLSNVVNVVPQQVLPFRKVVLSSWYVDTFYEDYKNTGGGLAFGALSEAVIGYGIVDLLVQALVLGLVFGWIHRRCSTRGVGFWGWSFYTWFRIVSYECFRDNSGVMIILFSHMWLPALVCVYSVNALLKGRRSIGGRIGDMVSAGCLSIVDR